MTASVFTVNSYRRTSSPSSFHHLTQPQQHTYPWNCWILYTKLLDLQISKTLIQMSQNFVEIHPLWMDLYSCPLCRVNRKFSSHGCGRVSNLMANVTVQFCCKRNVVLYWTWAFQSSWAFGKTSSNLWGQSSSQELYELSSTQHPTLWCECYGNEGKKEKNVQIFKNFIQLFTLFSDMVSVPIE